MALKKCKECGNDVSTEADSCPKCGAVLKKKTGFFRFVGGAFLIFITLVAVGVLISGVSNPPKTSSVPVLSEKEKAQRYEACTAMIEIARGGEMLYEFDTKGASIHVLVGQGYITAPIDAKKKFAEMVNCYVLKGAGGGVPFDLIHWQTGKKVASWNGYRLDVD